jgi:hypothetical protein
MHLILYDSLATTLHQIIRSRFLPKEWYSYANQSNAQLQYFRNYIREYVLSQRYPA